VSFVQKKAVSQEEKAAEKPLSKKRVLLWQNRNSPKGFSGISLHAGRTLEMATPNDLYMALAYAVRIAFSITWLQTIRNYDKPGVRIVSYLSAEFSSRTPPREQPCEPGDSR